MRRKEFRHGRLIYTRLLGRNGRAELHPAVIVSPDSEITQPEDFDPRGREGIRPNLMAVLGVSSQFVNFRDAYVRIPNDPKTLLTKECAVIFNWYGIVVIPDDVELLLGDVPDRFMQGTNMALRRALDDRIVATLVEAIARLRR